MTKQTINVGSAANDGSGTPARTAFQYINANFSEVYDFLTGTTNGTTIPAALPIAKGGTGATSAGAARTNLGLGGAATRNVGTTAGNLIEVGGFGIGGVGQTFERKMITGVNPDSVVSYVLLFPYSVSSSPNRNMFGELVFSRGDSGSANQHSRTLVSIQQAYDRVTARFISIGVTTHISGMAVVKYQNVDYVAIRRTASSSTSAFRYFSGISNITSDNYLVTVHTDDVVIVSEIPVVIEQLRTSGNTTVDGNGFLKSASPVVKLFNDHIELNSDAEKQPIEFKKVGVGDYLIKGSLGFAQEGWYIEVPKDANGNTVVAVEYSTLENGDISIKTYKRKFDVEKAAIVADLENPLDIPEGRWIDIRLHEELVVEETLPDDTE
ncbi:phage tail protein [Acinetobacter baumannii]|nr:phage tail protein [Acinetobacter baumannii]